MKRLFLVMLTLLLAVGASGRAQETTGGVEGTVKDQAGALIAGATIELTGSALIKSPGIGRLKVVGLVAGSIPRLKMRVP